MSILRPSLLGLAVFAVACTEASNPASPEALLSHGATPGHQVAGSGHVQTAAGLREFTFHSVEQPDGSVSGSFKVVLPNGLFFEADVTCMSVVGDAGWVAGRIRDTNAAPVVVGSLSMFYAIDGGEGEGATDIVSVAAFNAAEGTDIGFCEERPVLLAPLTVTDGNVQVR